MDVETASMISLLYLENRIETEAGGISWGLKSSKGSNLRQKRILPYLREKSIFYHFRYRSGNLLKCLTFQQIRLESIYDSLCTA